MGRRVMKSVVTRLMLSKLCESQRLLDGLENERRGRKRLVEPCPEIAVDEQIHPQQRHQIRQRPPKARLQLQVLEQQQRNQGGPNLNVQRVGRCADRRLHPQILFERVEEELDLPPVLINACHSRI